MAAAPSHRIWPGGWLRGDSPCLFLAATQPWMRCWCCYLPVYSSTDSWARCEVERSGCFHRVWGSTVYQRGIHSSFSINHRPKRSRSVYDRTSLSCAPLGLLPDALIPMPHRTTPCTGVQYWYESVSIGTNAKPDSTQGYRHTYKGSHWSRGCLRLMSCNPNKPGVPLSTI
jgi:hypothetical protein